MDKIIAIIARTQNLRELQVANTIKLLDGGATIPFVSRYRKEMTGGLDEVQIANIQLQNEKLQELCHRREYILTTIEEQGKLTPELKQQLEQCWDATTLEDIYLPYKPKRKTRAEAARKLGLEPLADSLMLHPFNQPEKAAASYVGEGVPDIEAALQGARDIIAERVNESNDVRNIVRRTFQLDAVITSKVVKAKQEEAIKAVLPEFTTVDEEAIVNEQKIFRAYNANGELVGIAIDKGVIYSDIKRGGYINEHKYN